MLEASGFVFSDNVVRYTFSGNVAVLAELSEKEKLNAIRVSEPINTHVHGREYHNRISRIGLEVGMPYHYMHTILGRLFCAKYPSPHKLLELT